MPYQELLEDMEEIFEQRGRPLLFAGGHEHSLQVIRHDAPGSPLWTAVSGSGSKLSGVGRTEGMLFGTERLGYMKLVVRTDGHMDLYAVAMPEDFGFCHEEPAAPQACASRALAAAETVYSVRLK